MKYSQLVHMSRDVEQWLQSQLKACEINKDFYTDYLLNILKEEILGNHSHSLNLSYNNEYNINYLFWPFQKEIESMKSKKIPHIARSENYESDLLKMSSKNRFSHDIIENTNDDIELIQSHIPLDCNWAEGVLHDSSRTVENKMDDFFANLFYDNTADIFGFELSWSKLDEPENIDNAKRINFYNKQNLFSSTCNERLYERNADFDKLIAKFDESIEKIWKSSSESDALGNVKYATNFSENIPDPYYQYVSDVIWSCEQKDKSNILKSTENYKTSFSQWNKSSSPVLSKSSNNLTTALSAFSPTLPNMKKWSADDGYNKNSNFISDKRETSFTDVNHIQNKNSDNYIIEYNLPEKHQNSREEDLLTSAKTHFRPIPSEELGNSQTGIYADGTTFDISNDLDKVSFIRSESGMLYLETEANTPRKYMEFKDNKNYGTNECIVNDIIPVDEFVPKFRVRQSNEKSIQTDEIHEEQVVPSVNDTDCDCDSMSCDSEENDFFFPGDNELAQNIASSDGEEAIYYKEKDNKNLFNEEKNNKDYNLEMSLYKLIEIKSCVCNEEKDWNQNSINNPINKKEWNKIWNFHISCNNCQKSSEKLSTNDKFRFRQELTQEGEQLLLDLSSVQQMYSNADWCEDDTLTVSDLNEDDNENFGEEITNDEGLTSEIGYPEKEALWSTLIAKEEPVKNGLDVRCLWKIEKFENDKNKFNDKKSEKFYISGSKHLERKRRNSSSQKVSYLHQKGECRQYYSKLSNGDSRIPFSFFKEGSCIKEKICPLFYGTYRPLSV